MKTFKQFLCENDEHRQSKLIPEVAARLEKAHEAASKGRKLGEVVKLLGGVEALDELAFQNVLIPLSLGGGKDIREMLVEPRNPVPTGMIEWLDRNIALLRRQQEIASGKGRMLKDGETHDQE